MARVIPAMVPSNWYIEHILSVVKPEKILFSYWYLRKKGKQIELPRALDVSKQLGIEVFVDSGAYTLKIKQGIFHVGSSLTQLPEAEKERVVTLAKEQYHIYSDFADQYIDFLLQFDDYYAWAFDLDFDPFLGIEIADEMYNRMIKRGVPPQKIIRVWHSCRTLEDWRVWCETPEYKYLAIEGGNEHGRNPDFYNPLVATAHKYGKKVHVLAITDENFLKAVPVDTGDSSTYTEGSRFAMVRTPWGRVAFSSSGATYSSPWHYDLLDENTRNRVDQYFEEMGYNAEQLRENHMYRTRLNLLYFLKYVGTIPMPEVREEMTLF